MGTNFKTVVDGDGYHITVRSPARTQSKPDVDGHGTQAPLAKNTPMKRSVIEQKLNDAMRRRDSAQADEWRLTSDINYHDQRASEIRKNRQKVRGKKDRAEAAIVKLSAMLQQAL